MTYGEQFQFPSNQESDDQRQPLTGEMMTLLEANTQNGFESDVLLGSTLLYDTSDPYVVSLELRQQGEHVGAFVLGRELIAEGLRTDDTESATYGEQYFSSLPSPMNDTYIHLNLRSLDSQDKILISRQLLQEFLDRTYEQVPPGDESQYINMEYFLTQLFLEESGQAEQ